MMNWDTYRLVRQVGLIPLMDNHLVQSVIMVGASLSGMMCVLVGFLFHVFSPVSSPKIGQFRFTENEGPQPRGPAVPPQCDLQGDV